MRFEIYLNDMLASMNDLEGLAFLKYESACLLGDAYIIRIDSNPDPVLGGRYKYTPDGGWAKE